MSLNKSIKITDKISVIHGECIERMSIFPDKSVDMILCDLPYSTTQNKWDCLIPFDLLWEQYERIIKDNGAIVLTAQTPFDKKLGVSNLKLLRYEWIWEKPQGTGFLNANKMPLKNHENILVFYKKSPIYNPQKEEGKPYKRGTNRLSSNYGHFEEKGDRENKGERFPKSILKFNMEKGLHPTQKPVALMEYLIKTYTNENDLVLDNCMGSGTTGVACKNLNRRFIGIEQDEKYFNIALERISK